MPEYQLQIKQVVDYPRCRIYREFIHKLINDRSIRINGGSGLFHFTVLCSYANFRTSYRRIDGISYTVSPGEWVCTVKELSCWFRTRFHRQALSMLDTLQKQHLISYTLLGRGNVVKYKSSTGPATIPHWSTMPPAKRIPVFSSCQSLLPWNWSALPAALKWTSFWICGYPLSTTIRRCRGQRSVR